MRSLNIRNFWKELNVQFQFSHLTGKNYKFIWARTVAVQNSCSFQGKGWTTNQSQSYKTRNKSTDLWPWNSGFSSQLPNSPVWMGQRFAHGTAAQQQHHQPSLPEFLTRIYWQPCSTSAISCRQKADRPARSQTLNTVKWGEKGVKDHPYLGSFQSAGHKTLKYYTQKVAPSCSDLIHQKRELDFYSNPENP